MKGCSVESLLFHSVRKMGKMSMRVNRISGVLHSQIKKKNHIPDFKIHCMALPNQMYNLFVMCACVYFDF